MRVGTAAKNHPRYKRRAIDHEADDRMVCPGLWLQLSSRFLFTIDAAAGKHNNVLPRFWTREDDALKQVWQNERVWVNPPFSDVEPWIIKAWFEHLAGCRLIVMLLPATKTEQPLWHRQIEPFRDKGHGLRVEFIPGRPRFRAPDGTWIGRPQFGLCLLIWQRP